MGCFTADAQRLLDELHADGWDVEFQLNAFDAARWVIAKIQGGYWRVGADCDLFVAAKQAKDQCNPLTGPPSSPPADFGQMANLEVVSHIKCVAKTDGNYSIALVELYLPLRLHNVLERLGIGTLGELCACEAKWLLQQRNIGKSSLVIVRGKLAELGLRLADEVV